MSRQGLAMASSHNEYHQSIAAFPGREAVAKGLDSTVYKKAASAQKVFRWASEYCAKDLASICYGAEKNEGPWMTVGLVTHCYGIYRTLEEWRGRPKAFAGYSQGEFTACAAAGVFGISGNSRAHSRAGTDLGGRISSGRGDDSGDGFGPKGTARMLSTIPGIRKAGLHKRVSKRYTKHHLWKAARSSGTGSGVKEKGSQVDAAPSGEEGISQPTVPGKR